MRFDIRRVKNGCVLVATSSAEETGEKEEIVYQEDYDDGNDIECFADFLRLIADTYGPSTSRYSPKRIYVDVRSGDKYETPAAPKSLRKK
jgi:hypothetical protein